MVGDEGRVRRREQWFHHCSPTCTCITYSIYGLRPGARKSRSGDVIVVRYADDLVVGFQHRTDAERFLREFRERLAKFGLELHAEKTRLIEFGRFAARKPKAAWRGKTGDLHVSGFHPLLWADTHARSFHRLADHGEEADGCEVESHQG